MMMRIRVLTAEGLERFSGFLEELRADPALAIPVELLEGENFTAPLREVVEIRAHSFATRFEAAACLIEWLDPVVSIDTLNHSGLWSWLALAHWDTLCPPNDRGHHVPGDPARYILHSGKYTRYYRHLLAMPYRILRSHRADPESARSLLCGPVHAPGELAEQISAYQEFVSNGAFVALTTKLYFDAAQQRLKRGSGGSGQGSPRRLAAVAGQLDVTYDFYSLKPEQIAALLPREFDRFLRPSR